jgi:hypothetical protein
VLRTGNNRKNMVRSTEASLKRLKTDRIDSSDQLARLDAASAVPLGFPLDFLAAAMQNVRLAGGHPEKIDKPTSPAELRLDAGFDQRPRFSDLVWATSVRTVKDRRHRRCYINR